MPKQCGSSNIPKLEVPEFRPSIPQYMVDNLEDNTLKFLIEQVSIIKQQNKWQSEHLAQVFDYTRKINGQVIELEKYRQSQELNRTIKEEVEKKKMSRKKYILPSIAVIAGIIYPLYISIFLQAGPDNIAQSIIKFFQ